jgi:acyl-CoA dehydrogenase-like protein
MGHPFDDDDIQNPKLVCAEARHGRWQSTLRPAAGRDQARRTGDRHEAVERDLDAHASARPVQDSEAMRILDIRSDLSEHIRSRTTPALPGSGPVVPAESTSQGLFGVAGLISMESGRVQGRLHEVPLAEDARTLLVEIAKPGGGPIRFAEVPLTAPGVAITWHRYVGLDGFPVATVDLPSVAVDESRTTTIDGAVLGDLLGEARLRLVEEGLRLAGRAVDEAFRYATNRPFGGGRLINQQVVRHALAEVAARIEISRAHLAAAWSESERARDTAAASVAVLAAGLIEDAVQTCAQFCGGRGFLDRYWISAAFRDGAVFGVLLGREDLLYAAVARRLTSDLAASRLTSEGALR